MKRDFHIGPGAASLILIVVILAMSVLSILALTNARNDERLSVRADNVVMSIGELNLKAERSLAKLDSILKYAGKTTIDDENYLRAISEALPENMNYADGIVSWDEEDEENRVLRCAVQITSRGSRERYIWQEHRILSEFAELELEEIWN